MASPELAAARPDAMVPRPFRVRRARRETRDTVTLELAAEGGPALEFRPGQFNMVAAFGGSEVPISVSGDPARPEVLVHTVRAVGLASRAIAGARRGDVLLVRGPFGSAWPVDDLEGADVVLVAGGIGLAPLRPALYRVLARRERFARVALLVGARTPADLIFAAEFASWRGRFDVRVAVTVDAATPAWHGHVGVVTTLFAGLELDPAAPRRSSAGPR
jgi:NAD(P)H-flavin reductase